MILLPTGRQIIAAGSILMVSNSRSKTEMISWQVNNTVSETLCTDDDFLQVNGSVTFIFMQHNC